MSTLDSLKQDWESLAAHDAFHAILTDSTKKDHKWNPDEFMATGEREIEVVFGHLGRIGLHPEFTGEALDFGCGVGRLTQALARRFASCIGVDISATMIRQAEVLNRYPHCSYVVSSDRHLPFASGRFSFIYSNIVLQHTPPRIAVGYVSEFVRILADDGVLVFGVQDSFRAPDLESFYILLRNRLRIRSRIKSALHLGSRDMQMHCLPERTVRKLLGDAKIIDIQNTNTGAKDFNGRLVYLERPLASGYIGKQYCVVKSGQTRH